LLSCEEVGEAQARRSVNMERGVFSKEKSACLCVTNDTRYALNGKIRWELRDMDSNILQAGEEDVSVSPLSVKRLEKMDFSSINPQEAHLSFALTVDGKVLSEGSVLFTQAKYYNFQNPNLRYEIQGNEILVYSDAYAKTVWIEGVDGDLLLEDNGFDMEKGCKKVRILSGAASKLTIKSVYDIR
jgi:beta-mannosidase